MDYNLAENSQNIHNELNCKDCGALLLYAPGAQKLACKYCGAQNDIHTADEQQ
jgi:LSD1 subclass zinc finger protein